jgi:ATP-dependent DNA ligase
VIGGYIPNGDALDSILVGYYVGRDLMYAASVGDGFLTELRRVLLLHFEELRIPRCQLANLPDRLEERWGEGLTAVKMTMCRWLEPFIVARIEFLEWTPEQSIAPCAIRRNSHRQGCSRSCARRRLVQRDGFEADSEHSPGRNIAIISVQNRTDRHIY